jgi:UDP-N-acetylglucosamine 2-epimerase
MIGCGTRPEIIRLAAVIKRCREYFDCCVVYYNQNWDRNLSTVFRENFELKNTFGEYGPDILVPVVGENLGVTCGKILGRSYELLSELQPEDYLVLGDTNSCLSAISAKRLHIPLFHMEAGNCCKDECLPEESSFYLSIGHPIAAVCIRTSTERPEALEAGDFILAGITTRELLNATDMAIEMKKKGVLGKPCPDYVDETVSMKVVRIVQGYVNMVNKMMWRKY